MLVIYFIYGFAVSGCCLPRARRYAAKDNELIIQQLRTWQKIDLPVSIAFSFVCFWWKAGWWDLLSEEESLSHVQAYIRVHGWGIADSQWSTVLCKNPVSNSSTVFFYGSVELFAEQIIGSSPPTWLLLLMFLQTVYVYPLLFRQSVFVYIHSHATYWWKAAWPGQTWSYAVGVWRLSG